MAQKPLMLKEYLELDSSLEPFQGAPTPQPAKSVTVRCLLDTELCGGADSSPTLGLSRSKGALRRLSAVISIITILQSPSAGSPSAASGGWRGSPARRLTRTFSKKLRLGFWKKSGRQGREGKESKVLQLKDIGRLRSFGEDAVGRGSFSYPSPVVSSCSSLFDGGDSTVSEFLLSSAASSAVFENGKHESPPTSPRPDLSPTPSPQKELFGGVDKDSSTREPKENSVKAMDCPSEEEKEQLSPVAVMDFPYQDDDDDEEVELPSPTSSCSPQNIPNNDRTKNQHLQKIRRFQSLAELHPVDLDRQFACAEASAESTFHVSVEEEDAVRRRRREAGALLRRLTCGEAFPACDEKLLFDFFADELSLTGKHCRWSGSAGDDELLRAASGWVHGGGGAQKHDGAVVLVEMERSGGWRRCQEEEEMVAAEMAGGLVAWLVEELVDDLVQSARLICEVN